LDITPPGLELAAPVRGLIIYDARAMAIWTDLADLLTGPFEATIMPLRPGCTKASVAGVLHFAQGGKGREGVRPAPERNPRRLQPMAGPTP
jgi:hypothetical protein